MSQRTSVLVRFPPALLARVDRVRGALNRHAFLIDLIERGTAPKVIPQESPTAGGGPAPTEIGPGVDEYSEVRAESSDSSLEDSLSERGRVGPETGADASSDPDLEDGAPDNAESRFEADLREGAEGSDGSLPNLSDDDDFGFGGLEQLP